MSNQGQNNNAINERTYQEVEYLKKNLGPILVAALAEICIRRPADPIEYLGHWLLRWRYNEELKRRDVQNALEVVRQRQWAHVQQENDNAAPPTPEPSTDGFIPSNPHGPPGFGGPLAEEGNAEEEGDEYEEGDLNYAPPEEAVEMIPDKMSSNVLPVEHGQAPFAEYGTVPPNEGYTMQPAQSYNQGEYPPQHQMPHGQAPQDPSMVPQGERRTSQGQAPQGERRLSQEQGPQGERRVSQGQAPQGERRVSQGQAPQGQAPQGQVPQGERRVSQGQASQGQVPQGERRVSQGQAPQGERRTSQGQAPQGERRTSQGQAPQGERRISQGQAQNPGQGPQP